MLTRGGGYLVRVRPGELDRDRFERLVQEASGALGDGDARRALELLGEAFALWRGPPLADFAYEGFAQQEIARLEELHLTAVELRIEAELALGQHARLIGELETLVERHPFRERLRAQLMLALYRAGRQTEALEAYQTGAERRSSKRSASNQARSCERWSAPCSPKTRRSTGRPPPTSRRLNRGRLHAEPPDGERPRARSPLRPCARRGSGCSLVALGAGGGRRGPPRRR